MTTTGTDDGSALFLTLPWLEEIDDSIRLRIWRALRPVSTPARATLLDQGRPTPLLWFVAAGSVAVERARKGGRAEILTELTGSAIYGTTTFFRASPATMTLRATTPIEGWTLDRAASDRMRSDDSEAAEALALAVVKVLSDRFDMLDRRLADLMARHEADHPRLTEWADFRSRLFEEPAA